MNVRSPHYLLFSGSGDESEPGRWRFLLRPANGTAHLAADDVEPNTCGERLELLAVVRGLEALDQPSRVTLVTPSTYVLRGIRYGLSEWRRNGWRWESFGEMVPVKNRDLWQRIDRAMRYHQVDCRTFRFDPPHLIDSARRATANDTVKHADEMSHADHATALTKQAEIRAEHLPSRCRKTLATIARWSRRQAERQPGNG